MTPLTLTFTPSTIRCLSTTGYLRQRAGRRCFAGGQQGVVETQGLGVATTGKQAGNG